MRVIHLFVLQETTHWNDMRIYRSKKTYRKGGSLLDKAIDKLPIELHIPGYHFCGPGTKLTQRLKRGDKGINKLDTACKAHDIAYWKNKGGVERRKADSLLGQRAWARFRASDSTFGEKLNALAVSGIMKAKSTLGFGVNRKCVCRRKKQNKKIEKSSKTILKNAITNAAKTISSLPSSSLANTSKIALNAAKAAVRGQRIPKNKMYNSTPRIIPVPKIGGVLPLIPIFAGLSALGSLIGGVSSIAKAVKLTQTANDNLEETIRHNKAVEAITIGQTKTGNGLYLKPYKNGLGLYIKPYEGLGNRVKKTKSKNTKTKKKQRIKKTDGPATQKSTIEQSSHS